MGIPTPPSSAIEWLSIVFHSITMALVLVAFLFRLARTVKKPTVINMSFTTLLFLTLFDLMIQILNNYVFFDVEPSMVWRIMSIFLSLPYILTQIYILSEFQEVLNIPVWYPKAMAIGSVVLHVISCVPGYSYILVKFAHQDGYLGFIYLLPVWYIYIVVMDNYINVLLLRTIIGTLEAFKAKEDVDAAKNRLTRYVFMVAGFDFFGIILNAVGGLNLDSDHLTEQEFGYNDVLGFHIVIGSLYLITVVGHLKTLEKSSKQKLAMNSSSDKSDKSSKKSSNGTPLEGSNARSSDYAGNSRTLLAP